MATIQPLENLESERAKKIEILRNIVQMKSLAIHITNKTFCFDKFTVGNLLNIFMEHELYFKV